MKPLSTIQSNSLPFIGVVAFIMAVIGCGDTGPASVTENVDQTAIEEYKAMEAKLAAESEAEFSDSGVLD
ncbi:MAG: hypothetical protein AAGJ40_04480 [Planctomycetota bacterium]